MNRASLESHSVALAGFSFLAIVAIYLIDSANGSEVWLHILYVFPVGSLGFFCAGIMPVVIGVLLSLVFLALTLFDYDLSTGGITGNLLIACAAYGLVAGLTRSARSASIAMETLSATDALTGLHNRRSFEQLAEREIARHRRYRSDFSLVVLDLNRFKLLNDSRGHGVGDLALRLFAEVLRANIREVDIAARLGGDEFIVIMPRTNGRDCAALCEKLSSIIGDRMKDAGFALSASIGHVCSADEPNVSLSVLMKMADDAMYAAKGRSRESQLTSIDVSEDVT